MLTPIQMRTQVDAKLERSLDAAHTLAMSSDGSMEDMAQFLLSKERVDNNLQAITNQMSLHSSLTKQIIDSIP